MKAVGETANWVESAPLRVMLDTTMLDNPVLETTSVFCENEPMKVVSITKEIGALMIGTEGGGTIGAT